MSDNSKVLENPEGVKNNFEYDENMRKIKEEIAKKFTDYRKTI